MTSSSKYAKVRDINRVDEESKDDEGQGRFMRNPASHRPYDVCHSRSSRNNLEAYEHCRQIMKMPRQYKLSNDTVGRRLINRNNNDQQYLKDEIYKEWRIGVEYNRTTDKPKIDWQTKQQMDVYGLLGGCCKTGDHFSDKTHKCRRTEQTTQSSSESDERARSLSRPSRDKTRKTLHGILKRSHSKPPVRSRSVCFSDKNEEFLVEYDSDDEDMSQHDLESGEVGRSDTEIKNANAGHSVSKKGLGFEVAERKYPTGESMCTEQRIVRYIKPAEKNLDLAEKNLDLEKNYGNPKLNDLEPQLNNIEGVGKFHGFSENDKSNEMSQLELRTFIIQMENKHEEACEEFAQNYYDVILETTLEDYRDGLLDHAETNDDLMDVQNDSIVFIPKNDSTHIEDIYEDNLTHNNMIEDNNETIIALNDIHLQLNSNEALEDNLSYEAKEKLELVQPTNCNQKPCTKDNNLNANIRENMKIANKTKLYRNSEIIKADVTAEVDSSSLKIVPLVGVGSTDTLCESLNAEIVPSDIAREVPCSTVAYTELPAIVSCSTCCSVFLSESIGLEQMLEDRSQWQCQDCAICILCFVRTQGGGLLMCCKCGRHYHKACVRMEEEFCRIFVCKFCTPEEDEN